MKPQSLHSVVDFTEDFCFRVTTFNHSHRSLILYYILYILRSLYLLLMEFPSKLCSTNIQPFLVVRGNEVTNRSLHSASITANVPIPIEAKCYYYEITARNVEKGSICFGLIPEHQFLTEALLGKKHGYGLRSDGRLFSHLNPSGIDWSFSSGWGNIVGDTVGCGIFFDTGEIFFTKGKKCCGVAFTLPPDVLKKVQSSVSVEPLKSSNTASSKVSKSKCRQLIPCVTVGANRKVSVRYFFHGLLILMLIIISPCIPGKFWE